MTVRYSRIALRELDEIATYITQDNPQAAVALVGYIKASLEMLEYFPNMGQRTDDEKGARVLIIARTEYKAYYDVDAQGVVIQRVRHGAMDK